MEKTTSGDEPPAPDAESSTEKADCTDNGSVPKVIDEPQPDPCSHEDTEVLVPEKSSGEVRLYEFDPPLMLGDAVTITGTGLEFDDFDEWWAELVTSDSPDSSSSTTSPQDILFHFNPRYDDKKDGQIIVCSSLPSAQQEDMIRKRENHGYWWIEKLEKRCFPRFDSIENARNVGKTRRFPGEKITKVRFEVSTASRGVCAIKWQMSVDDQKLDEVYESTQGEDESKQSALECRPAQLRVCGLSDPQVRRSGTALAKAHAEVPDPSGKTDWESPIEDDDDVAQKQECMPEESGKVKDEGGSSDLDSAVGTSSAEAPHTSSAEAPQNANGLDLRATVSKSGHEHWWVEVISDCEDILFHFNPRRSKKSVYLNAMPRRLQKANEERCGYNNYWPWHFYEALVEHWPFKDDADEVHVKFQQKGQVWTVYVDGRRYEALDFDEQVEDLLSKRPHRIRTFGLDPATIEVTWQSSTPSSKRKPRPPKPAVKPGLPPHGKTTSSSSTSTSPGKQAVMPKEQQGQKVATPIKAAKFIPKVFSNLKANAGNDNDLDICEARPQRPRQEEHHSRRVMSVRQATDQVPHIGPKLFVAIVVPFREQSLMQQDRPKQRRMLMDNFETFLVNDYAEYVIVIARQSKDNYAFNRGQIRNAGYQEAKKFADKLGKSLDMVIFHDVDLLPNDTRLKHYYYTTPPPNKAWNIFAPHMCYSEKYRNNDRRPGMPKFFGGVVAMRPEDFERCNGFPIGYWGWGLEDDQLRLRLEAAGLKDVERPEGRSGCFRNLDGVDMSGLLHSLGRCPKLEELRSYQINPMTLEQELNLDPDWLEANGLNGYMFYTKPLYDKSYIGLLCEEESRMTPQKLEDWDHTKKEFPKGVARVWRYDLTFELEEPGFKPERQLVLQRMVDDGKKHWEVTKQICCYRKVDFSDVHPGDFELNPGDEILQVGKRDWTGAGQTTTRMLFVIYNDRRGPMWGWLSDEESLKPVRKTPFPLGS